MGTALTVCSTVMCWLALWGLWWSRFRVGYWQGRIDEMQATQTLIEDESGKTYASVVEEQIAERFGVRALARWKHQAQSSNKGLGPPQERIP